MAGLLASVDPEGLLEYSVVFTDRSLNHMSQSFQGVMNDISRSLKEVYRGSATVLVPGGGTFAMEAVARQFATNAKCLVIRNGLFSYRWTQIFEAGDIPSEAIVIKASRVTDVPQAPFAPAPLEEIVAKIQAERPAVVFAPHVETSAGVLLPERYIREISAAVRAVDGLFVLDCVASGAMWVDMQEFGVDVLVSAPQKGWSSSPCAGFVMLGDRALARLEKTASTSFSCDLKKWLQIMQAYENGGHAYHATMPTDALKMFRDAIEETRAFGFDRARAAQQELGDRVRALLASKGIASVAADGFQAPSVVVSYTDDPAIKAGKKFMEAGVQIAAGVPLKCDEPAEFQTFRIGLFGLDKLQNVDRTVDYLDKALCQIF